MAIDRTDTEKKIAEIRKSAEEARKTDRSWVDGQDYADDVEFLLNELERLQQENAQLRAEISRMKRGGWVSVKERLPDDDTQVLAVDRYGDQEVVLFVDGYFQPGYIGEVTHWMPLPKPPS